MVGGTVKGELNFSPVLHNLSVGGRHTALQLDADFALFNMDPISIIAASTTLVRLCATASGYIFTFVTNVRNVDTAITTLGVEVSSLSQVLSSINDSFNDSTLANAALSSLTGHEA